MKINKSKYVWFTGLLILSAAIIVGSFGCGSNGTNSSNSGGNTKYSCSGSSCVADPNGIYAVSNCNNTCGGGGGSGNSSNYAGTWNGSTTMYNSNIVWPVTVDSSGNFAAHFNDSGGYQVAGNISANGSLSATITLDSPGGNGECSQSPMSATGSCATTSYCSGSFSCVNQGGTQFPQHLFLSR